MLPIHTISQRQIRVSLTLIFLYLYVPDKEGQKPGIHHLSSAVYFIYPWCYEGLSMEGEIRTNLEGITFHPFPSLYFTVCCHHPSIFKAEIWPPIYVEVSGSQYQFKSSATFCSHSHGCIYLNRIPMMQ